MQSINIIITQKYLKCISQHVYVYVSSQLLEGELTYNNIYEDKEDC